MPSVYDPENFAGRVNLAAFYMIQGREPTRAFDTCFEMYDGDAVGVALYRRMKASKDSGLAWGLPRYLNLPDIEKLAADNAHRKNLAAWARELRAEGERTTREMLDRMKAEQEKPSSFTPAEQDQNDCQRAFELLAARHDATCEGTAAGPRIEIKRQIAAPGTVSDGTRAFIIAPCDRWRWLTVTLGWDTLAEIDQRNFHQQPEAMAAAVLAAIDQRSATYRTDLTPAGEQFVIPGCERRPPENGKPAQLSLF